MNFGLENISRSSRVPAKLTSFIFLNCHVSLAKKNRIFLFLLDQCVVPDWTYIPVLQVKADNGVTYPINL